MPSGALSLATVGMSLLALLPGCAKGRHDAATSSRPDRPRAEAPSAAHSSPHAAFGERSDEREALVRALAAEGVKDEAVLRAMRTVPRHAFVEGEWASEAYANRPLPIPGNQTISQPYVVAFMTEVARPAASSRCLEIGTGSGYQAAVLAELCGRTYSIEYLPEVARFGERNLRTLGYGPDRVSLRVGDGYAGWKEAAPFDVVLVTAAPERVPQPLLDQLAVGGRLVIPVGPTGGVQSLELWTRVREGGGEGAFRTEKLLPVRFVPFAGEGTVR